MTNSNQQSITDEVIEIGGSLIHHGKKNDRVYIMKFNRATKEILFESIDKLVKTHRYSKIFAKIPAASLEIFINLGYQIEAEIPGFYSGKNSGFFLCKYFTKERETIQNKAELAEVLSLTQSLEQKSKTTLEKGFTIKKVEETDAHLASAIYRKVFKSYPFPIFDPDYILETMRDNILYHGVYDQKGSLVSIASAEMSKADLNVEMTDFATLTEFRGKGFGSLLLSSLEDEMQKLNYKTLYTIARAISPGMNIVFKKSGYKYAGTLKNNTDIAGSIESMNIWYKSV